MAKNERAVHEVLIKPRGWANVPTLRELKGDLEQGREHHNRHVGDVNTWLDNLNVTGSAAPTKVVGRSAVQPKLIRKQAEWRYASLSESFLSEENLFTCEPVTWEDKAAAEQNELLLNHQFNNQINKVNLIDEYVRAAVNEGSVLIRVGWEFEEEEVEVDNFVERPITNPQQLRILDQAITLVLQNPEAATRVIPEELQQIVELTLRNGGAPTQLVLDENNPTRKEMQTIKNQPFAEICDYASCMVDPTCQGDLMKANFIALEFETSLGELKKEGKKYKNLDKIDIEKVAIKETANESQHSEDSMMKFQDDMRKRFKAYEYWGYWDVDGNQIPVAFVATWVGDTMIRLERSPFPDNQLPFVLVKYLPKRKHVYGEPDGALLEDNQKIVGAVTRGMLDIMGRTAVGQQGIRKDALDVSNWRKFQAGKDYKFNTHVDPRVAFHTNTYPEIPSSAEFVLALMNNEAEALTGVKAFHKGITGEGLGRSATAARSAIDAAGKRELGILRRLAAGLVEVGRKFMTMNAEFLDEEEVVRITNDEFVPIKRDDLSGRVDVKLKISSAEADNAKAQELAFMLQTTGPNDDPAIVQIIRAEIARLRKMPDLAKRIEEYQPQPDPLAIEKAKLENEEIKAKIRKLNSEAVENMAEAALDQAGAREKHSKADLQDQKFVHEEDGTTHVRDLERIGEQAASNEDLEITKSLLAPSNEGNSQASTDR